MMLDFSPFLRHYQLKVDTLGWVSTRKEINLVPTTFPAQAG